MNVDPFVLIDEITVKPSAGFPEHPHRGFEALTYMLEGSFIHKDSSGSKVIPQQAVGLPCEPYPKRVCRAPGLSHALDHHGS